MEGLVATFHHYRCLRGDRSHSVRMLDLGIVVGMGNVMVATVP